MENPSSNMAPPGTYESQEAREAQPTATSIPTATGSPNMDEATSIAASSHDDVQMREEDTTQVTDASMDQEEKGEEGDNTNEPNVVVNLKFLHRERITIHCAPTILIADLKRLVREAYIQAIQQEVYIQAIQQDEADGQDNRQNEPHPASQPLRLIYKGKVLKDDQRLAEFNFVSEDTIHAIFSRPQAVPPADTATGETTSNTANNSTDRPPATNTPSGPGISTTEFVFETADPGRIPDITNIIRSVVNSAMNASDGGETTAAIRIFPLSPRGESVNDSTSVANSNVPAAASTSQPRATAQTQRGASVVPTPTVGSAPVVITPLLHPQPSAVPPTGQTDNSTLLNQAAAIRRSIPALELAPLSRPSELSEEMYSLGNAMRESGDTYLAIHRQLQFLATRFHQENHLSDSEQARLRSRVQQLIPVMQRVGHLSTTVSQQLGASAYGQPTHPTPTSEEESVPYSGARVPAPSSGARVPATESAPQPPTTSASQPPFAQAMQSIFADMLGAAGANGANQPPPTNSVDQALSGLPGFLTSLVSLAAPQTSPSATHNGVQRPNQSGHPSQSPQPTTGSSPSGIFRSFAPTLMGLLNANPTLINSNLDEFLRATLPDIDQHIVRNYYTLGPEVFVQTCVTEVENALRLYEQAHQHVYVAQESRRSIIRLAVQELAQLSLPMAASLQSRCADMQAWIRRSCSHLYAELCEIAPATTAAQMTGLVVMQLLSGNDQAFLHDRSPFLDRVATEIFNWLRRRFQLS